jgi:inner membrane transporter RhtA
MSTTRTRLNISPARTGTAMALGSMTSVQLGLALSVPLFGQVGPLGVVWLRLAWAALILPMVFRPRPSRFPRKVLLATVMLGVVTAGMTMLFMSAVARLPLGTASALEFLGPLGVAVTRGRGRRRLLWPALAAAGVLLLTHPWQGHASLPGLACALGAALCWAGYILLTQAVGDEVGGLQGLAVSIATAALVTTVIAGPHVIPLLTPRLLLDGLGLAVLVPMVPFSLEMCALRRLNAAAFGTLMCLEPVTALAAGLVVLHQVPRLWSLLGVAFVITAGVGAERAGARSGHSVPADIKNYVRNDMAGVGSAGMSENENLTPQDNPAKDPEDWVTGDEPMTGPQKSYLQTLAREAGRDVDLDKLTKADASVLIDELQEVSGRGN